jgi:hypothetical protein
LQNSADHRGTIGCSKPVIACLVRDPVNQYDRDAIRVEIRGSSGATYST